MRQAFNAVFAMRPMREFDPERPSLVHDVLYDRTFTGRTCWADSWHRIAVVASDGLAYWDSLILDGWEPLPPRQSGPAKPAKGDRVRTRSLPG